MKRGFQRSETSRAEVTVYSFADEPGLFQTADRFQFFGPESRGGSPVLISVSTSKSLGVASGSFTFDVKADRAGFEAASSISDDDWVDIVFTKHAVRTHVIRGQIDCITHETVVTPNGTTMNTIRFTGRCFGRIFELTPIWFDILTDGALGAGATARVLEANAAFFADPATTVEALLAGFLKEVFSTGRANWQLPPAMPAIVTNDDGTASFSKNVCFFDENFLNYPERSNAIDFSIFPGSNQSIWDFAMTWADREICECYTDLLATFTEGAPVIVDNGRPDYTFGVPRETCSYPSPVNDPSEPTNLDTDLSVMGVVFRDRPFPTFSRTSDGTKAEEVEDGPWFKTLKVFEIAPEHISQRMTARSGAERKNAFYAAPRVLHELTGGYFDLNGPLWNPDDMLRHGFRRNDSTFDYVSGKDGDLLRLSQIYRQRIRDFHCLNHLFYSGQIVLGHGRPDIRIGQKLRVVGDSEDLNENYYVEGVRHSWSLTSGVRTQVTVSRGFIGSDQTLLEVLTDIVSRYRRTDVHTGNDEPQPEPNGPPSSDGSDSLANAEHFPPFDTRTVQLFTSAAGSTGVPSTWADPNEAEGQALHELLRKESGGYVGRPNYTYGVRAQRFSKWREIWAELKAGQLNQTGTSSATGLGQLILSRVDQFYPSGRSGIGVAADEAAGMLAYIDSVYGSPSAALAFHRTHSFY